MKQVLKSDSLTRSELAEMVGFNNPDSLKEHVGALIRQKYLISDQPAHLKAAKLRLTSNIKIITKFYHDKHYKTLKVEIRALPSVLNEVTQSYSDLPVDLFQIIRSMVECSDTFFEITCENKTPEQLMHSYRYLMYPYQINHEYPGDLQLIILIHELYSFALVRDLKGSDLASGFCEPLKNIRKMIKVNLNMGKKETGCVCNSDRV